MFALPGAMFALNMTGQRDRAAQDVRKDAGELNAAYIDAGSPPVHLMTTVRSGPVADAIGMVVWNRDAGDYPAISHAIEQVNDSIEAAAVVGLGIKLAIAQGSWNPPPSLLVQHVDIVDDRGRAY